MNETSLVKVFVLHEKEVVATTSLQVAAYFGKEHKNVMADVRAVLTKCSGSFGGLNFQLSSYQTEQNKDLPMYILSKDGFMMLVMGYTGEKAMAFKEAYITQFNVMEEQLRGGAVRPAIDLESRLKAGSFILDKAGIFGNQHVLALDKIYRKHTGDSMLDAARAELVAPIQEQLLTPTELGKELNPVRNAKSVNKLLSDAGLQTKLPNGKWQPTEKGKAMGAELLDTNKRHSDGTPVCQVKWRRSPELLNLLCELNAAQVQEAA